MINTLPINDIEDHVEDTTCWCYPEIITNKVMKNLSKTYRHSDNPEEKRFYDAALELGTRMLSSITLPLNDRGTGPSRYLNKDEKQLVINTLQWLGSPVGQSWLEELGYLLNSSK